MATLRLIALTVALVAATPARADPVASWRAYVAEASARFGVPLAWIERVMRAESGGRTMLAGRPITSRAGAMGLMQLMPETWGEMRAALGLGVDPHDPRDNILAGTYYLRLMYDHFGYPGAFAAYNAGPGRYADYLAGRASLPVETRNYLAATAAVASPAIAPRPSPPSLFFLRATVSAAPIAQDRPPISATASGLFVTLTATTSADR
jgi:soluble lytic murein transglycosylase-like protein